MSLRLLSDADALSAALDQDHRTLTQGTHTGAEHLDAVAAIDEALAHWVQMRDLDDEDSMLAAELIERLRAHRRAHVERLRHHRGDGRST